MTDAAKITTVRPPERSQELIRELDTLREKIASGEIVDYALATVYSDRKVGAYWSKTVDKWRLVGAIENMKMDLAGST